MGIFFALVTVRSVELVSSFVRLCRTAFTMTYSPLGVFFDGSVHWTSLAELNVWRRKNSHLQSDSFTKAWRALFPSRGIRVSKGALGKYVGREKEHKGSGQMLLEEGYRKVKQQLASVHLDWNIRKTPPPLPSGGRSILFMSCRLQSCLCFTTHFPCSQYESFFSSRCLEFSEESCVTVSSAFVQLSSNLPCLISHRRGRTGCTTASCWEGNCTCLPSCHAERMWGFWKDCRSFCSEPFWTQSAFPPPVRCAVSRAITACCLYPLLDYVCFLLSLLLHIKGCEEQEALFHSLCRPSRAEQRQVLSEWWLKEGSGQVSWKSICPRPVVFTLAL